MNNLIKHINAIRNIPVQEDAIKYKRICELIDREGSQFEEKTGKWLWVDGVRCSRCNYKLQTTGLPSYCPNCGAKMEQ